MCENVDIKEACLETDTREQTHSDFTGLKIKKTTLEIEVLRYIHALFGLWCNDPPLFIDFTGVDYILWEVIPEK